MKTRMLARGLAFSITAVIGAVSAEVGLAEDASPSSSARMGLAEGGAMAPNAVARIGQGPEHWGSLSSVLTIASGAFVPYDNQTSYSTFNFKRIRTAPGGSGFFDANVDLPAGAKITSLEIEACDTDPAEDVVAFLAECFPPGAGCSNFPAGGISTSGTPGCNFFALAFDGPVIDRYNNTYAVRVRIDGLTGLTGFRAVRVFYRLQTSPAPGVATFPNDVPTTHAYFRFIEALAAAGVTGGCAPGSYCPDSPVTRGEMAVFLSVALGLYWPF